MKKIGIFIISLISILSFCNADLAGFTIDSYTSSFKLRDDGILEVTENIDVNFSEHRHGIYRTIPYIYSNYLKTPIKKVKVPGYKFTTSKDGNNYQIKIGSANKTVIGKQNYSIQYQIKGSVREFSGYQELYWNILGTERNTPVNDFNFSLELPSDLNLKDNEIWVYIGEKGSNDTSRAIKSGNIIRNAEPLNLGARQGVTLAVRLPIDYVPTKKYYSLKGWFIYHSNVISIGIRSIVSSLIGFFSIRELVRRYKRRRELRQTHGRKIRNMVYYTPPKGYTAMDVASIYNWKSNFDVLSAFLFSWIADGYVHIKEVKVKKLLGLRHKKDYYFIPDSRLNFKFDEGYDKCDNLRFDDPERRFWNLCFVDKDINKLYKFNKSDSNLLKEIADEVFFKIHTKFIPNWRELYKVSRLASNKYKYYNEDFYKKIYLNNNPNGKFILNRFIGIIRIFTSLYLVVNIYKENSDYGFFSIILFSFWIVIVVYLLFLLIWRFINNNFSFKVGGLKLHIGKDIQYISEEGIDAIEQTLGFRKYLLSVDDDKLRTLLKEDPTYFEKNLPYAIALDIGDHWIKKCVNILEEMDYSPKGISVSDNNRINAITYTSSIGNSISSTVYEIDHPSSSGGGGGDWGSSSGGSSGGGSSGGGGGGGGGGSW